MCTSWLRVTSRRVRTAVRVVMWMLLLLQLLAVSKTAGGRTTAPAAPGRCVLTPVDAMVQITPWSATPPVALAKPVAAARGELVHVQALLTGSASGSRPVTATVDAGTLGAPVTVRQVAYSDLNVTFGAGRPAGLYPAVLVPLTTVSATHEAHGQQPPVVLWLSVRVPQSAPPGLHTVRLHASGGACTAPVETTIEVLVSSFVMPLPGHRSQTTEASFQVNGIAKFGPPGSGPVPAPETVMAFFRSMSEQGVDAFIFWEHGGWDRMPWAPSYRFNKEATAVTLNTTLHQLWWSRVLKLTGPTTRWRMPFSDRVVDPHNLVTTDTNWTFVGHAGEAVQVPVFKSRTPGELNPTFERMFKALFCAVAAYLQSNGWAEHGSWVAVIDEPSWWDHDTVLNTIALAKLYHSISPSVKVYQTRWPDAGYGKGFPANCRPLLDLVDEWCVHVIQWVGPGVPAEMAQAKADRKAAGKPPMLLTVYDNGIPITEAPNERARFQALDVWRSNGTLDGTLSWYSIDTYVQDPWLNPYPGGPKPKPAGYGYELWPPAPSERTNTTWAPRESVVWVMLGAGLQDAEYLYALQRQKHPSDTAKALMAQARTMASAFPYTWGGFSPAGRIPPDWGDDGYQVDAGGHSDGSSVVNTWKLAMGSELAEAETRCDGALARLCTSARGVSAGQCLACAGQQQAPLMRSGCSQLDFGRFCSAPRAKAVPLKSGDDTSIKTDGAALTTSTFETDDDASDPGPKYLGPLVCSAADCPSVSDCRHACDQPFNSSHGRCTVDNTNFHLRVSHSGPRPLVPSQQRQDTQGGSPACCLPGFSSQL